MVRILLQCVAVGLLAVPLGARSAPMDLFFSEYIEGSSNNKALEIFNGTGASVDLAAQAYSIVMYFNGSSSPGATINLTGEIAHDGVYVVAHSSASASILALADQTSGTWYNGDDAIALLKGMSVIDVIGQIGVDPGSQWGSGLASTTDNTLRRKPTVLIGDSAGADVFDPSMEWMGYANDTFDGLGVHSVVTQAVPEPAVPALLLAALAALAVRRRYAPFGMAVT